MSSSNSSSTAQASTDRDRDRKTKDRTSKSLGSKALSTSAKRIQKELAEITLDPPPNCRYIHKWTLSSVLLTNIFSNYESDSKKVVFKATFLREIDLEKLLQFHKKIAKFNVKIKLHTYFKMLLEVDFTNFFFRLRNLKLFLTVPTYLNS